MSTVKLVQAAAPAAAKGLWLLDAGRNKIGVIKEVREATRWGLKEAKDLVDDAQPGRPQQLPIAQGSAEQAADALRRAGATVELRL
jgi:large subunit ribosomal protein L7/L12